MASDVRSTATLSLNSFKQEIAAGAALGFGVTRVENVTTDAGTKLTLLTMHDAHDTLYVVQKPRGSSVTSFSTFFNEGELDLVTGSTFADQAPKAVRRIVDGSLEDVLIAHHVERAALVAHGYRPMTTAHYDLFNVATTIMQRHSAAMSRNLGTTIFRHFVPNASMLRPLTTLRQAGPSPTQTRATQPVAETT